jgi:MATE family multidrug resistance protein
MSQHGSQKDRIIKLLITGWPIIAGQVGLVLMGVADTVMVGKIGYISLAAAGLSVSIFFLISIFGIGLITATASLVTSERAKNNEKLLPFFLRDSILLGQLTALFLFILLLIIGELLPYLDQKPEVIKEAKPFLFLLALSIFPMNIYMSGKNLCDGYYLTLSPMLITFGALLLNIFLNWIFIYGHWGMSAMGLAGAGWATLLSRLAMGVVIFLFVFKSKTIGFSLKSVFNLNFKFNYLRKILKLGVPTGFQYFFEVAAFSGAAILAGVLGAIPQAAHQIAINVASLTFMFATGIAVSGSIYVAENYAHGDLVGVRKYGKSALWLVVVIEFVFALLFITFYKVIPSWYNDEIEVLLMASQLILIASVFQVVDGIQAVSLGLLRGLHDTKIPSLLTFITYWLIGLPLSWYFALHTDWGIYGIWWSLTLSLFFISITTTWRFNTKTK